ncbi:MAG: shikimate dehydrogenase [Burkholderiaceae bacterium]
MTDRYAVIGNPVAHSRSPSIHAQFAEQTGQDLVYERLHAPVDAFDVTVDAFRAAGGRGLNVTLPFKVAAHDYANARSARARAAGAANTLRFEGADVDADNTDGVGLVRDLSGRLGFALAGARVLLAGAGGAARGVILPLLEAGVASLVVANRTLGKAAALAALAADARVSACGFDLVRDAQGRAGGFARDEGAGGARETGFDLIVNATSAGLSGAAPALAESAYAGVRLAYDMVYAAEPTVFMRHALALGCPRVSDGLGMLVEQAAESFRVWRGVSPQTEPVYRRLRAEISGH